MSFQVGSGTGAGSGGGGGGTGISEADAIALIEARYRVIDGKPGIIPAAAASQKLKLAPDNSGIVRTLVEHVEYAVARSGDFSVYTDRPLSRRLHLRPISRNRFR